MKNNEKIFVKISDIPMAIPYNYRTSYKVSQLCMIISKTKVRGGVSLVKINIISSALNNNKEKEILFKYIHGKGRIKIKIDPRVNLALNYAYHDNLIKMQKNGKYILTEKGKTLVDDIYNHDNLFSREKRVLEEIGTKLLEKDIDNSYQVWRNMDAYN